MLVRERLFGFKCEVRGHNSRYYSSVPQPTDSSSEYFCSNGEDRCFYKFDDLKCFRCFNGTIILYSQVCDGTVDCQDLSDGCTCENSRVQSSCKLIYDDKQSGLHKLGKVCDFNIDLLGSFDEKYCSYELMHAYEVCSPKEGFHKRTCGKDTKLDPQLDNRRVFCT